MGSTEDKVWHSQLLRSCRAKSRLVLVFYNP
jgi:hypothetical protein